MLWRERSNISCRNLHVVKREELWMAGLKMCVLETAYKLFKQWDCGLSLVTHYKSLLALSVNPIDYRSLSLLAIMHHVHWSSPLPQQLTISLLSLNTHYHEMWAYSFLTWLLKQQSFHTLRWSITGTIHPYSSHKSMRIYRTVRSNIKVIENTFENIHLLCIVALISQLRFQEMSALCSLFCRLRIEKCH